MQKRKYMALAFVAYLEDAIAKGVLVSRHFAAVLALEAAMARSRRPLRDARRGFDPALAGAGQAERGDAGERLATNPGVLVHRAPGGVIQLIYHVEKYLFQVGQVPALALCDDAPRPEPLPALDEGTTQPFLLEPRVGGKVDLSEIGADYAAVIEACARPVTPARLAVALAAGGNSAADAGDRAASLLEAEVLRRLPPGEQGEINSSARAGGLQG